MGLYTLSTDEFVSRVNNAQTHWDLRSTNPADCDNMSEVIERLSDDKKQMLLKYMRDGYFFIEYNCGNLKDMNVTEAKRLAKEYHKEGKLEFSGVNQEGEMGVLFIGAVNLYVDIDDSDFGNHWMCYRMTDDDMVYILS